MTTSNAEIWVDPLCPWAWMTSRWLLEVEQIRPVNVTFRIMSLAYLNRDREMPESYQALLTDGWKPVRVLIAAGQQFGQQTVRDLYGEMGMRLHPGGKKLADIDEVIADSLSALGLSPSLAESAVDMSLDEAVIKEHEAGVDQVGTDVGTPIISVNGVAFFGPVVTPAPRGDDAARLWDGIILAASTPGFYELKRSRTQGPKFD
jgi:hypothetical protein